MQTDAIITTLLAAAAFLKRPLQDVTAQPLKDAYEAAKNYLRKKFGEGSEAAKALELATGKPESLIRKALLAEEITPADLGNDPEVTALVERLAALLPASSSPAWQSVHVAGQGNTVQVAGRDIIHTEKHVQRNAITPDERHLTVEQREKLNGLVGELAARLANEGGTPNFAAAHRMLQRRFNVASYLLILRKNYEDALGFLRQRCAINRSRLRNRNPAAYQNDFFRSIHARREKLGWDKPQLHRFACEKLGLKTPIASLKDLGPIQLKSLAEFMQRQAASA
jgi:predicted small secreted protein